VYASAFLSLATGQEYDQYWKYDGTQWHKLFDNQDTTGNVITLPGDYSAMVDVAAYRCSVTDSLQLYFVGGDSFFLQSKGQRLNFSAINLSAIGLPLRALGSPGYVIGLFTPNDIWVFGIGYYFYQWNGVNFQQMIIPGLPGPGTPIGIQRRMIKTGSGKVFMPSEVSSQIYVVVQGTL
jgi:hypothetical protein